MSEAYEEKLRYHFGEFTLDAERAGLFRNGTQVRLRPKSFDVLRYLVERPGKVVGRDELLDSVWAGTVVTDESVTQCLIDIRKALGDSSQTMIRTVPRRGYVFELPVEALGDSAVAVAPDLQPETASRLTGRLVLAVVAIVAAAVALWFLSGPRAPEHEELPDIDVASDKPSIAVLPFESMGADDSRSYFADGVSEEIINSLARQQGLKVIARTSSFSFRGQNANVAEIAAQLDVSHVLEGSVRNDADAFRINVQLVDAGTGEYVWIEQFDRELSATSVFAIQSEIATAVVRSLQTELTPEEQRRFIRVPTENMAALDAYFEARQLMESRRPRELDRAADLLHSAIGQDPDFALAYVALADTLRLQSNYGS
ncbi:MAG: winged helix-turn-helix domain-containing protein, partial [Gammaproteobacteria bacterium]|nr:winged helix-turn-helix domain-containing protein [Gammaproteobacteria bacterium]